MRVEFDDGTQGWVNLTSYDWSAECQFRLQRHQPSLLFYSSAPNTVPARQRDRRYRAAYDAEEGRFPRSNTACRSAERESIVRFRPA
jgi:hypothetical protein